MWPLVVVLIEEPADDDLALDDGMEQLAVEALVAHHSVEPRDYVEEVPGRAA
jgi:hypothetical protein